MGQTRTWDANSGDGLTTTGGTGTWDTSTANWHNGTGYEAWNSSTAIFGGTAGTVTLGSPVTASGLTFNTSGYTITGTSPNALTLSSGATINTATGTATINAPLAGTTGFTKAGSGTLVLGATNSTLSGGIVINAGELRSEMGTAATGIYSNFGTGSITANAGTTLRFRAGSTSNTYTLGNNVNLNGATLVYEDGNHVLSGNVALTGSNTINGVWSGKTLRINGIVSGAGSITHTGGSTLTLAGANTYSGGTVLNGGTIAVNNTTALGTGAVSVTANSAITTGTSFANNISIDSGRTLSFSGNFHNVNGIISGAGNVTATGSIQLRGENTYTGITTASGGFLCIDRDRNLGAVPTDFTANSLTFTGGGFLSNYIASSSVVLNANRGVTLATGSTGGFDVVGQSLAVEGVITGAGTLTKRGDNVLILRGANTYTGGTVINNGTVSLGTGGTGANTSSVNALGSGNVTINSGTTLRLWIQNSNSFSIANNLTINGGTLRNEDGIYNMTGTVSVGATGANLTTQWNTKNLTLSGVVSGSGPITISTANDSASQVILSGANTFTGPVNVASGTLSVGSLNSVVGGTATSNLGAPITVANGTIGIGSGTTTGTLLYTGNGETTDRVINLAGTSGGTTITQSGTGALRFSSNVTATGVGSKTLTLSGSTAGTGEIAGAIVNNGTTGSTSLAATFASGATTVTLASVDGLVIGASISGAGIAPGSTITAINTGTRVVTLSAATTAASGSVGSSYTVAGVNNITSLTKTGSGTWILSGTNTYTGATTISGGTLQVGNGGTTGSLGTGSITNNGTLAFNRSDNITVANAMSGTGSLVKNGSGALSRSIVASHTGGTTINAGTLSLDGGGGAIGTIRGTVTVNSGGTLRLNTGDATGYNTDSTRVSTINLNGGTLNINTTANQTLGSAVINMTGGAITGVANSNLDFFGGASALNTLASATTSSISGVNINLRQNNGVTLNVADGAAVNDLAISSVISNATGFSNNNLTKTGAGTLLLSGANTYTSNTNVNAGTVKVGNALAFGAANTAVGKVVVASGATVDFNGQIDATYGYTISGNGVNGNGALVNNGATIGTGIKQASNIRLAANASIGGTGDWGLIATSFGSTQLDLAGFTLTKLGSNTVTLVNATTTAGNITVAGGTLAFQSSAVNGAASSITLNDAAGVNLNVGVSSSIGALSGGGAAGGNTTIGAGATLSVGALNTSTTYAGVIGGSGSLTKTGTGTFTVSGANTYTGATNISAGTLEINGSTAAASTVNIGTAGTLAGSGTVGGNVTLTGAGVINKSSGGISGTLNVTGGNWNGAGSVTGAVTSSSGNFNIGSGANLTANGGLNVTGGTLASSDSSSTITGSVNYTSDSSSTFAGVIAGSGNTLTMNNANSTLTLSGANTYTGATNVNAGTLLVNNAAGSGTGSGAVSVATGAVLGGTGTIAGSVTVSGTLAPGASIESLDTGEMNFIDGSTFAYELNSLALNGDLLNVAGDLNIDGTVALQLSELIAGVAPIDSKLTLISYSGTWNGGLFDGYADDSFFGLGSNNWVINYNDNTGGTNFGGGIHGNFVTMTAVAVPEPSSIVFGLVSGGIGFIVQRRRRKKSMGKVQSK